MGEQSKTSKGMLKIEVVGACGCCGFTIVSHDMGVTEVYSNGLSHAVVIEKLKDLQNTLPGNLRVISEGIEKQPTQKVH